MQDVQETVQQPQQHVQPHQCGPQPEQPQQVSHLQQGVPHPHLVEEAYQDSHEGKALQV